MTQDQTKSVHLLRQLLTNSFNYNGSANVSLRESLAPFSSLKFHRLISSISQFIDSTRLHLISSDTTVYELESFVASSAKSDVHTLDSKSTDSSLFSSPFPINASSIIGLGVDIEQLDHSTPLFSRENSQLRASLFTPSEVVHCVNAAAPELSLLGVFCAKEAIIKACSGTAKLRFSDIVIYWDSQGSPFCRLPSLTSVSIFISISHTANFATATAIAILDA